MEKKNMRHEAWRDGEFQEDDVWDVLDGYHQSSSSFMTTKPSFSTQSLVPTEPQKIPRRHNREGMAPMRQHSVPVNVPDWSIVHKRIGDDDENENVSPEEYFLRRNRSSTSSSVMEGVGRKLKGRDLSKVRNAVLKKTGFLE